MKTADIDKAVFGAIEGGAKCRASIRSVVGGGIAPREISESVQRLRYAGRVTLDKIAVNRVAPPPVAVAAAAPTLAEEVRAEAAQAGQRRRVARSTGTVNDVIAAPTPAERVVSAMIEAPADLYVMVKRQWPELLARVIAAARAELFSPVQQLVATIEAGLDVRDHRR